MVFLGLLFRKSEEHSIATKSCGGTVQNQVNTFQWNCIDGLRANGLEDLCILSSLPVGIYPMQYSDLRIPSEEWEYNGVKHYQIGSVNLPVIKQFTRYRAVKKLLKSLGQKEILIYSAYEPYMKAIRKLDRSYKVNLIVPDLPDYYDYAEVGLIRKFLRKVNNRSIRKCMSRIDRFILLTEAMKEPLLVGDRPYVVMEGICTAKASSSSCSGNSDVRAVLYTGSLNKQFGIDVLLDAFRLIEHQNYQLWICGSGDYEDQVKLAAENDSRIKYFGFVPTDKVEELRSEAAVLVNPRQNTGEYTKYSFPSKTMEYLLSGLPVVGYKLHGIPDEYDSHMVYVEDNTPGRLAQVICDVCGENYAFYKEKAEKAVEFVLKEKNSQFQTRKILDLIRMAP